MTITANTINIGTLVNDGTGDPLRTAFTKVNSNFSQLYGLTQSLIINVGDETTNISTGVGKITFRMPHALTLTGVRASLTVAQAAGANLSVNIKQFGTSILSTGLSFDNNGNTTVGASTPPAVISNVNLVDNGVISVDVDVVGTPAAKGLKVYLTGLR